MNAAGICQCGCGNPTRIYRGVRMRFVKGHHPNRFPKHPETGPFKIDGNPCRLVPVGPPGKGFYAIVDAEHYTRLIRYTWQLLRGQRTWYARRAFVGSDGKEQAVLMHVEILGKKSGYEIDHVNRNGLDNRDKNLRHATRLENGRNLPVRTNNTSGCSGVNWDKRTGKWEVRIRVGSKRLHLGRYETLEAAVKARQHYETQYWAAPARGR